MGWYISEVKNEVILTEELINELHEAANNRKIYVEEFMYRDGVYFEDNEDNGDCIRKLAFYGDHMEHMDYLGSENVIIEILKKHKVKGDICFQSTDGDNAGDAWGYRFDGKGGMKYLTATMQWSECEE